MVALDPAQLVGAGGVVGALLRHAVHRRVDLDGFPLGTITVNAIGSFVLGLATFAGLDGDVLLFVAVGACGSFTTFSTFSFETVRLWEMGDRGRAFANAGGNLAAALLAIGLAWALVTLP